MLVASSGSANAADNPIDKQFAVHSSESLPVSNFKILIGLIFLPNVFSISSWA